MISFYKKTLLAGALLLFISSPGYAEPAKQKNEPVGPDPSKEIILRVNKKEFTRENLNNIVNELIPSMSIHSTVSDERMKKIQDTAFDQMINRELLLEEALKLKTLKVSDKEIDAEVNNLKKKLPKGLTLDKVLKNSHMDMKDLREEIRGTILARHYLDQKNEEFDKKSTGLVTEAFIKDYYQKNLDKFKEPEQIHLRTILIKADPSGGQAVWDETRKKALEIKGMVKKGEDFGALAQKYSQDPYAKDGGDMGWTHTGSLYEEIDGAAAKMKPGEVSDPVMTIYGYHLIKLEGRKPASQKKFEELNAEKLKKELQAKEYKKLWDDYMGQLKSSAKIEHFGEFKK